MQEWLTKNYGLIVDVCRNITVNYQDLAHDIILKLPTKVKEIPQEELRYYIYRVAKNQFLSDQREKNTVELTVDLQHTESEQEKDPYEYIQELRAFRMKEPILGIVLELYYFHDGNISDIERSMKRKNCGICRQTLTKYIKEAKQKLKEL